MAKKTNTREQTTQNTEGVNVVQPTEETTIETVVTETEGEAAPEVVPGDEEPTEENTALSTTVTEEAPVTEITEQVDPTPAGANSEETASVTTDAPASVMGEKPAEVTVVAPVGMNVEITTQTTPTTTDTPAAPEVVPGVVEETTNEPIDTNFFKSSILVSIWKSNLRDTHGYRSVEEIVDLVVNRSDETCNVQVETSNVKMKLDHEIANVGVGDVKKLQSKVFFTK